MLYWVPYFDLEYDYETMRAHLALDAVLSPAVACHSGLRILNQPVEETLFTFILSANNNIKRIQNSINSLCARFGAPVLGGYAFPTAEAFANAPIEALRQCGLGYRAQYIQQTAHRIIEGFDLPQLKQLPYKQAHAALMTLPGVGPKVADCVLLFACGHRCAFPIDTWIKKALLAYYPQLGGAKNVQHAIMDLYGAHAGYAQQLLFMHMRTQAKNG